MCDDEKVPIFELICSVYLGGEFEPATFRVGKKVYHHLVLLRGVHGSNMGTAISLCLLKKQGVGGDNATVPLPYPFHD
ncbi:hypothetical protein SK128_017776 [Halocaridina rubra]|uniref:Uncharacterized protein n=1 Tax=Halocaridina rubra TaxID=373956 RepID=A0AAN9AC36_HALRR